MIDSIQRLRGLACLMVFCQHICLIAPMTFIKNFIPSIFQCGSGGVHLFFAISGFVIALSLKQKLEACCDTDDFSIRLKKAAPILADFWKRRLYRLLPVLIVFLIVVASFYCFIANNAEIARQAVRTFFDIASFSYNDAVAEYVLKEEIHFGGTGPLWTLSIEIMFYLLFPLTFLLLKDQAARLKLTLVIGVFALLCFRWIMGKALSLPNLIYYSSITNIDGLLLGSFLGLLYNKNDTDNCRSGRLDLVALVLVFGIWCLPSLDFMLQENRHASSIVFFSVLLIALAAKNSNLLGVFGLGKILEFLGNRSYSFYVWQLFLAASLKWLGNSNYINFGADKDSSLSLIFLLALFIVTELSYRFLEKPFRVARNAEKRQTASD